MCQIIVKPEGKKFNMKKLDVAQGWNEDGYGVTWWEDNSLQTFTTMDYKKFKSILSTLKDHKAVAHLRHTTRGETCLDNNHPFEIPSGMMFHNGTISGVSCSAGKSDTQELARLIGECEYTYIEDIMPLVHNTIGDTINRLVFFEDDGRVTIVNEDLGQTEDGIWYSNDYHTKSGKRPKTSSYGSDFLKTHEWDKAQGCYVKKADKKQEVIASKAKNDKTRVFVYGTLKEGFGNHSFFLGNAKKIGEAVSVAKWAMIGEDMAFPYLLGRDNTDGHNILGEVYEVTKEELAALDRLEGVPSHYKKSYMYVSYKDGQSSENVMVYVKSVPTVADYSKPFIKNFIKRPLTTKAK